MSWKEVFFLRAERRLQTANLNIFLQRICFCHPRSYLCKTQICFVSRFRRGILLSYFRNFFAYFHIYTSEWQRASLASVALTLRIAINGTFSMNILYNIMQRNIISSTSKPSPDSENREKENICSRFEK